MELKADLCIELITEVFFGVWVGLYYCMLTVLSQRRGQDGGMDYPMSIILFILNLRPAAKSWEKNEKPPFEGDT